jgi:hypothetical protein
MESFLFVSDIVSLPLAFVKVSYYRVRKSREGIDGLCEPFLAPIARGAEGCPPRALELKSDRFEALDLTGVPADMKTLLCGKYYLD